MSAGSAARRAASGGALAAGAAGCAVSTTSAHPAVVLNAGIVSIVLVAGGCAAARYGPVAWGVVILGAAWCAAQVGGEWSSFAALLVSLVLLAVLEVSARISASATGPRIPLAGHRDVALALLFGGASAAAVAMAVSARLSGALPAVVAALAAVTVVVWPISQFVRVPGSNSDGRQGAKQ